MSFSRDPSQPWRWNSVSSPETAIQRVPVTGPMASHDIPPLGFPPSLSGSNRSGRASPGRASPGRASPGPMVGRRDWRAPWDREVVPPAKGPPSPSGSLSSRVDRAAGRVSPSAAGRVDRALEVRQARREAAEAERQSRVSSARADALTRRAEREEVTRLPPEMSPTLAGATSTSSPLGQLRLTSAEVECWG